MEAKSIPLDKQTKGKEPGWLGAKKIIRQNRIGVPTLCTEANGP